MFGFRRELFPVFRIIILVPKDIGYNALISESSKLTSEYDTLSLSVYGTAVLIQVISLYSRELISDSRTDRELSLIVSGKLLKVL